jgi:hypothetical protein
MTINRDAKQLQITGLEIGAQVHGFNQATALKKFNEKSLLGDSGCGIVNFIPGSIC